MGLFSNLFKKKPGGTLVGNLIRSAANKLTDGALGNGANMISQQDYDKKTLSDVEYYNRYGMTKNGVVLQEYQQSAKQNQQLLNQQQQQTSPLLTAALGFAKKNIILLVLPFGVVIGAIIFFATRKRYRR